MLNFRSNGKFLLSGEYLVLKGALALAIPLKLGQTLEIKHFESGSPLLTWDARALDKPWFKAILELPTLNIVETNDEKKTKKLQSILTVLQKMNPNTFLKQSQYQIITNTEFDTEWGLGSSSTLISNLATWAKIDAFELLKNTFGGSGYDVACAQSESPILYQLFDNQREVIPVQFDPIFSDKLYFVYLGQKQDSSVGVKKFCQLTENKSFENEIAEISKITKRLISTCNYIEFCSLTRAHEQIISECIQQSAVKERFGDFDGHLKSLGAWGGDFILAMSEMPEKEIRAYFNNKGLKIIFRFDDLKYSF